MMKKIKIVFVLFFSISQSISQNLVPNGSFEQYDTCPNNSGQGYYAMPWFQPAIINNGNITNSSSVEYYNSCSQPNTMGVPKNANGKQLAKTGGGYAGFLAISTGCPYGDTTCTYREYLEVSLTELLNAGSKYCVEFYCSLSDSSTVAVSHLGLYFSADSLIDSTYFYNPPFSMYALPYTPQIVNPVGNYLSDTSNWMLVSGIYLAQGAEQFLTIGNYRNDAQSDTMRVKNYPDWLKQSYYYIDDVSVTLCTDTCQPPNTQFTYNVNGQIVNFTNLSDSATNWFWYFGDSPTADTSQNPVHTYNDTGIYNVILVTCNQTGCCNEICCDTMVAQVSVSVGVGEIQNENYQLQLYPNPSKGEVRVSLNAVPGEEFILAVSDITGRKIKEYRFLEDNLVIPAEFDNGIYFLSLYNSGSLNATEKLVIVR